MLAVGASRGSLALKGILDLITVRCLEPGDRLPPVQELAATLELSTVTVREALQALESLGILRVAHGKGIFVAEGGPILEGLFEARRVIECYHVREAAIVRSDRDLRQLDEMLAILDQDLEHGDGQAYTRHDVKFHQRIGAIAANRVLLKSLQSIRDVVHMQLAHINQDRKALRVSRRRHLQIVAAIRNRDAAAAESAMSAHVDDVIAKYRTFVGGKQARAPARS
ncbi:MAG: FadR family transcriptional regulator [Thermoleophilia bacterium]|nr:FadR family transcriptional regulator [Thermoleophilia bacterium]